MDSPNAQLRSSRRSVSLYRNEPLRTVPPAKRRKRLYAVVGTVLLSVALVSSLILLWHPPKDGSSGQPLEAIAVIGPIRNASVGAATIYTANVTWGNPTIPLTNFSFRVLGLPNPPLNLSSVRVLNLPIPLNLSSVCVTDRLGTAIGTWVSGNWSTSGTSTTCSSGAKFAPSSTARMAANDTLFFYFGSNVMGPLPEGTTFELIVPNIGTVGVNL